MDFISLTIKFLSLLAHFVGNYGLAIILLTIIVRGAMWHLNVQQDESYSRQIPKQSANDATKNDGILQRT